MKNIRNTHNSPDDNTTGYQKTRKIIGQGKQSIEANRMQLIEVVQKIKLCGMSTPIYFFLVGNVGERP